LLKKS